MFYLHLIHHRYIIGLLLFFFHCTYQFVPISQKTLKLLEVNLL